MEYVFTRDLSIYSLIVAGASKKLVTGLEKELGLKTTTTLPRGLSVAWQFQKWAKKRGHINWLLESGFIAPQLLEDYKVGDKFDILIDVTLRFPVNNLPIGRTEVRAVPIKRVGIIQCGTRARLVLDDTREVLNGQCRIDALGYISDKQMRGMVFMGFLGMDVFYRKVCYNGI